MPTRKTVAKQKASPRKPAKPSASPRRRRPQVAHLHVVVDPDLLAQLEARARELDPRGKNLSAAVRALLRAALNAPQLEAGGAFEARTPAAQ